MAIAEHDRGGLLPRGRRLGAPRRHGMAVEQDCGAEALPGRDQRRSERFVIGSVDLPDPPVQLAARDTLPPDRAGAGDPRRYQSDSAAGAGRLDDLARRKRRCHQHRIDLALVPVEVDLGSRRERDEGGRAGSGGAPDESVDESILQCFQSHPGQPRGFQKLRRISASGMGHGKDDGREWLLRSDSDEGRSGWVIRHLARI